MIFKSVIFLEKCFEINFSIEELSNLLEGELTKDKSPLVSWNNFNFKTLQNYKFKKFKESLIFFEEGISLYDNEEGNYINIEQNIKGAKIYIINGELNKTIMFQRIWGPRK